MSKKKNKKNYLFLGISALVLITIAVVFLIIRNGGFMPKTELFFSADTAVYDVAFKNTYYFTTSDGFKSINRSGKDVYPDANEVLTPFVKGMKEPLFLKSDRSVLAFDISGKTAVLFNERSVVMPYTFDREIINAKMAADGTFVMVLNEDGTKAAVKAYNPDGSEILTWYSGNGYVVDAMTYRDKMAVLTNEADNGAITSKIHFFKLNSAEPFLTKVLGDRLCSYISYTGNTALVVCENGLYAIQENGTLTLVNDFSGKKPILFRRFTDGELFICYENQDNASYNMEVYNKRGKRTKKYTIPAFEKIVDIKNDKFLVANRKEVMSYSKSGRLLRTLPSAFEIRDAAYFKNSIVLLGNDRVNIK